MIPLNNPRRERALQLRQQHKTFREIGQRLGVSRARAEQLVRKAIRLRELIVCDPFLGLHTRHVKHLVAAGLATPDAVRDRFTQPPLPGEIRGIGEVGVAAIRRWLAGEHTKDQQDV